VGNPWLPAEAFCVADGRRFGWLRRVARRTHPSCGKEEEVLIRPCVAETCGSAGTQCGKASLLLVHKFRVACGNRVPRKILRVRQPASLCQRSPIVLVFQNRATSTSPRSPFSAVIQRQSCLGDRRRSLLLLQSDHGSRKAIPAMALPRRVEMCPAHKQQYIRNAKSSRHVLVRQSPSTWSSTALPGSAMPKLSFSALGTRAPPDNQP